MSRSIFVTGTGTDVGKTYVTGLIVKRLAEAGLNPAYYKAAMSGNVRQSDGTLLAGDAYFVRSCAKLTQSIESMCPYVYETAVSPHLAARIEGNPVQMEVVCRGYERLRKQYRYITVEGSGGILCPLRFDEQHLQLEDMIKELHLSSILVADVGLGVINSVVLTYEYMKQHGLPLKGVIYNRFHPDSLMEQDNIKMCERMTGLPTLACVQTGDTSLNIDLDLLCSLYQP